MKLFSSDAMALLSTCSAKKSLTSAKARTMFHLVLDDRHESTRYIVQELGYNAKPRLVVLCTFER